MVVSLICSYTTPLGAQNISLLYKERLVNLLERSLIFAYCGGDGICTNRTTLEFTYDSIKNAVVYGIEPAYVDMKFIKCVACNLKVNSAASHNLSEVAHSAQQAVGYSRSAAGAQGNFGGSFVFYWNIQNSSRTFYYLLKICCIVIFKSAVYTEACPERSRKQTLARGCTHQSKGSQVQSY